MKLDVRYKLLNYFKCMRGVLPSDLSSQESSRLVILLFSVVGGDILGESDELSSQDLIDWVYAHQLQVQDASVPGGFRSLLYTCSTEENHGVRAESSPYDFSHITMVYASLCVLLTLGDDLSRLSRQNVLTGIAELQCVDTPGMFRAGLLCSECDLRFVFSAVASCYILSGLDIIDKKAIVGFICQCLTHEGGFACLPNLESHAGATYCALASLVLLDRLDKVLPPESRIRERLIKWLISLQSRGFHGRPQKADDTCYTFWVVASLKLLHCESLVDGRSAIQFISQCWNPIVGGFSKFPDPDCPPDPLHSCLALSGITCLRIREDGDKGFEVINESHDVTDELLAMTTSTLLPIQPELNISTRAYHHLQSLHLEWDNGKRVVSS